MIVCIAFPKKRRIVVLFGMVWTAMRRIELACLQGPWPRRVGPGTRKNGIEGQGTSTALPPLHLEPKAVGCIPQEVLASMGCSHVSGDCVLLQTLACSEAEALIPKCLNNSQPLTSLNHEALARTACATVF